MNHYVKPGRAVATDYRLQLVDKDTPRGVKILLLGQGGVLTIGIYDLDPFWVEWAPLPMRAEK